MTQERFAPYGIVIEHEFTHKTGRDFEVVERSESTGWCVGLLELSCGKVPYLERHLTSKETHEPLTGVTVLLVAPPDVPKHLDAFLLDKPVCLNKGVWHQAMAISQTAVLKVVENLSVPPESCETIPLPEGIDATLRIPYPTEREEY